MVSKQIDEKNTMKPKRTQITKLSVLAILVCTLCIMCSLSTYAWSIVPGRTHITFDEGPLQNGSFTLRPGEEKINLTITAPEHITLFNNKGEKIKTLELTSEEEITYQIALKETTLPGESIDRITFVEKAQSGAVTVQINKALSHQVQVFRAQQDKDIALRSITRKEGKVYLIFENIGKSDIENLILTIRSNEQTDRREEGVFKRGSKREVIIEDKAPQKNIHVEIEANMDGVIKRFEKTMVFDEPFLFTTTKVNLNPYFLGEIAKIEVQGILSKNDKSEKTNAKLMITTPKGIKESSTIGQQNNNEQEFMFYIETKNLKRGSYFGTLTLNQDSKTLAKEIRLTLYDNKVSFTIDDKTYTSVPKVRPSLPDTNILIGVVSFIIIVLLAIVTYLIKRKEKPKEKAIEKSEKLDLAIFIQNELDKGFELDLIRNVLEQKGYAPVEINEALGKRKTATSKKSKTKKAKSKKTKKKSLKEKKEIKERKYPKKVKRKAQKIEEHGYSGKVKKKAKTKTKKQPVQKNEEERKVKKKKTGKIKSSKKTRSIHKYSKKVKSEAKTIKERKYPKKVKDTAKRIKNSK